MTCKLDTMEKNKKLHRQWIAAIIATIGLFMMGMNLGWPSPTLHLMRKPDAEVHLTEDQISWMVSVLYIGSTLSPVPTGWLMNWLGRRLTLMVLTSVALASWIILATVKSPMGVYIARFLGGMWGGSAYTVAPIYLCEIAEPEVRGALNTLFILMAYVGIMFEYCIGPKVSYTELSYISACVPATFVLLLLWVPESPYFYLMKGDRKKAGKALAWLRCAGSPAEVETDLSAIEKAVLADMQNRGRLRDLVSTPGNRKALLIAEMLAVLQRMSGISVVMAYASAAIPQTGRFTPNDCAVILCTVWIVFGLLSTVLVNWAGRRPLLAISSLGCALGNAMVAGWFFLHTNTSFDAMSIAWFPLLSFTVYGVFFPIGLGCIPGMIQPLRGNGRENMSGRSAKLRQWLAASIVSVGLFMTGMFLGWPSPVVSQLHGGRSPLTLSPLQVSWVVSLLYLGSVVSPLVAGVLMDVWGRRGTIRATAVLALTGWLLLAFRTDVASIFVARVLGGMWGGISYCITPVYLCEIADPGIRGALNTMFTLMLYLGIMFEYCVGALVSYTTLNLASSCVPLVFFLSLSLIPESPYFFLARKRKDEAREALKWLRCSPDVEKELESIEHSVREDMKNKGTVLDLVRTPGARRALLMTETVAFLQRNSGSSVMMAYISTSVPRGGPLTGDQCAVAMCCLWLVFGVASTFLVDRLGRRPLLAVSCLGCAAATAALTGWFYLTELRQVDLHEYNIIPFASFGLYALFFPFGLACVPSIVQGELFPSNVKGVASGLTAVVVASVSFVNNKLYQPLSETYGTYVNYLYFTLSSVLGIFFALFVLIETRNKTLQEINFELNKVNELSVSYDSD